MWIEALAFHSTMILVGIGMPTLVFACFALADHVDKLSKKAEGVQFALLRIARYLLGPACGMVVGTPFLYLLVVARVPIEALLTLLVSAAASLWLLIRYQPFGRVELPR